MISPLISRPLKFPELQYSCPYSQLQTTKYLFFSSIFYLNREKKCISHQSHPICGSSAHQTPGVVVFVFLELLFLLILLKYLFLVIEQGVYLHFPTDSLLVSCINKLYFGFPFHSLFLLEFPACCASAVWYFKNKQTNINPITFKTP